MKYTYYDKIIDKKTKIRNDITPLFSNPIVFRNLIEDLNRLSAGIEYDKIAGLDALGFILGSALSIKKGKGFIAIRKKGKLPGDKISINFVDYTKKRSSCCR